MCSDEDLVRRSKNNDLQAFEELFAVMNAKSIILLIA